MFDEATLVQTLLERAGSTTSDEATPVQTLLGWAESRRDDVAGTGQGPGDCRERWDDALDKEESAAAAGRVNADDDLGSTGGVTNGSRVAEDVSVEGVDLPEAHQPWKFSHTNTHSAGFVNLFCISRCFTTADIDGTAHTAVDDADVNIAPEVEAS